MNDFWKSVVTGAAVGASAYALHEAFGRDPRAGYSVFVGAYGRQGGYDDYSWSVRAGVSSYPRVCDWGFSNHSALDAWSFRRGYDTGFNDGLRSAYSYDRLPTYQGQYVPWWT